MVVFSCDKCSEALKKNQVEKHSYKCRYATYSCLDCNVSFGIDDYAAHIKCISENKKYGGQNYVEKENKGEQKQNRWLEQVERAISCVKQPNLKNLLSQILGFTNIPRKEAKFINFLQNSMRVRDRNLCVQAWAAIVEEARKLEIEEKQIAENNKKSAQKQEIETPTADCETRESSKNDATPDAETIAETESTIADGIRTTQVADNDSCENGTVFKWKRAIKRKLRDAPNRQMKIKKLRKSVLQEYMKIRGGQIDGSQCFKSIFIEKLQSVGAQIDGKMVILQ